MLTLQPAQGEARYCWVCEAVGVGLGPPCGSTSPAGNRLFASFSCRCAADKHCPGRNRAVPSSVPRAVPSMRGQRAIATNMDTPSSDLGKQCQLHSIPNLTSLWDAFVILVCIQRYLSRLMDRHTDFLVPLLCPQLGCPSVRTLKMSLWLACSSHSLTAEDPKALTCPASSGSHGAPRCPPPLPRCGQRP